MDSVPIEVLVQIFSFLNFRELARICDVCQLWKEVVTQFMNSTAVLDVSNDRFLDDVELCFLLRRFNPKQLNISKCKNISEASFECMLTSCTRLTTLIARGINISSYSALHLKMIPSLQKVDLASSNLSGIDGDLWVSHPNIQWLSLRRVGRDDIFQEYDWTRFDSLTHFETSFASEAMISSLAKCPKLNSLVLSHVHMRDPELNSELFNRLIALDVSHLAMYPKSPGPPWAAFEDLLKALPLLESLRVNHLEPVSCTDVTLPQWLPHLKRLKKLEIRQTGDNPEVNVKTFGDIGIKAIGDLLGATLEELTLADTAFTDSGLAYCVSRCPHLKVLSVPFSEAGDETLEHCTHLQHLDISACHNVSDVGLTTFLMKATGLQAIKIYGLHNAVGIREGKARIFQLLKDKRIQVFYSPNLMEPYLLENTPDQDDHTWLPYSFSLTGFRPDRSKRFFARNCDCQEMCCPFGCGTMIESCFQADHARVCQLAPRRCPNWSLGCQERLPPFQINSHLGLCPFNMVHCFECRESVLRRDYADHTALHLEPRRETTRRCPFRNHGCEVPPEEVTLEHVSNCSFNMMSCPVCKEPMLRRDFLAHSPIHAIPERPVVKCPYGCYDPYEGTTWEHINNCPHFELTCISCQLGVARKDFAEHVCPEHLRRAKVIAMVGCE